MFDWIKKIAGYAPDIALAVATGGTSAIATTALRIVSKELTGDEDAPIETVQQAVENATHDQLLALKRCNNEFMLEKMHIEAGEMASARDMYKSTGHEQADKIADKVMNWNMPAAVILGLVQILALAYFTDLPEMVVLAIGNVSGWIIKGLLDERATVCGFYFGSSIGSKAKDAPNKETST